MKRLLSAILVMALFLSFMGVSASAAGTGSVSLVPSVYEVCPGDTFTVSLVVDSNPGVMFFCFTPSYDTERLELVSMSGTGSGWTCSTRSANWDGASDEVFTGAVVTITFQVKDDAPAGAANIAGSVEAYNYNEDEVTFTVTPGTLTVTHRVPGDITGDGKVTVADVTLLAKYVKARGQGVSIVSGSGNVDGSADGKVTVADVTLLAKYVKARGQGVV
ncbi:MAG: hypothetical protein IK095_07430, partial [Oscillospiraceae bacterium]|nr:hypothetical protein [Oscillospiraceae bacterium]